MLRAQNDVLSMEFQWIFGERAMPALGPIALSSHSHDDDAAFTCVALTDEYAVVCPTDAFPDENQDLGRKGTFSIGKTTTSRWDTKRPTHSIVMDGRIGPYWVMPQNHLSRSSLMSSDDPTT